MPDSVRQAAKEGVDASVHYPDPQCRELRAALSQAEGVPEDWILCGNGAADLIFGLALAEKPRRALVWAPGFTSTSRPSMRSVSGGLPAPAAGGRLCLPDGGPGGGGAGDGHALFLQSPEPHGSGGFGGVCGGAAGSLPPDRNPLRGGRVFSWNFWIRRSAFPPSLLWELWKTCLC